MGFFLAIIVAVRLGTYSAFAAAVCALSTLWIAFQSSKWLRSGKSWSYWLAIAFLIGFCGVQLFQDFAGQIQELKNGDLNVLLGFVLILALGFWLLRGLLGFRALAVYQQNSARTADPLANHPWERGLYNATRPKFINQQSIAARFFLLLAPLPYLFVLSSHQGNAVLNGPGEQLGYITVSSAFVLGAVAWGTRVYRRGRRRAMMPASELITHDRRPIVLYLRSFRDDTGIRLRARSADGRILPERLIKIPFEELVTDHLWGYGPVLAIGNPATKSKLVPLGAARDFETDATWQQKAQEFMQQSSMIVVVSGVTQGLSWELETIVKLGFVAKLVIIIPPVSNSEVEKRWQSLSAMAIGSLLPATPDRSKVRGIVFPCGNASLITANGRNDWTYEAVLDEAALVIAHQTCAEVGKASPAYCDSTVG